MNLQYNVIFKLGAFSMVSLIALGAKYGHIGRLDADQTALFNKAQMYHLINNVGLVTLAFISKPSLGTKMAAAGFIGGLVLFCVPLYLMAIQGRSDLLSKTMPFGGILMLTGWTSMIFA